MRSIFLSKDFLKTAHPDSYSLSRTPIRDKDFKGFLDGKKTSIITSYLFSFIKEPLRTRNK